MRGCDVRSWAVMWSRLDYSIFFFKQKTAYEVRISDWSSDVCSSDLSNPAAFPPLAGHNAEQMLGRFGGLDPEQSDPDDVRYWAITPEELAAHVVHAIDAPAGITISDITVRATGEDYVF